MTTQPCRSCRAPVFWRRHVGTGRLNPIDAAPVDDGNIVLSDPAHYLVLGATEAPPDGALRYRSHFTTCPDAPDHRNAR